MPVQAQPLQSIFDCRCGVLAQFLSSQQWREHELRFRFFSMDAQPFEGVLDGGWRSLVQFLSS